ncbi:acyltransferase family protein [Neobacillus ginsengisoli]|uniref:Fucose 4-O-acetylase-like acetyltransferase n=1 Tax=Neobacillus ginsengisoli TaxID=904295 RepID=A0ABT9XTH2_9BACI|nr:acyltransferase family protein [Neobacillus ginsengisoli]MDQ0198859.1 fucose 4-O-acetylase-like acetyltransferase [Neobacillus ginsengisoli]
MSGKIRIKWLDTCKGIGILLVIIGHTPINSSFRSIIYGFHMPLFFFISGYFFSISKYDNFKKYFLAKVNSLLIPYFSFSIISFILLNYLFHQPLNSKSFLFDLIVSKRNFLSFDEPIWFLTSLFTIEMIYYFIVKYIKNIILIICSVILIGFFICMKFEVFTSRNILPWSLNYSLYFMVYFGLGNLINKIGFFERNLRKSYILILCFIISIPVLIFPNVYFKCWQMLSLPSVMNLYLESVFYAILGISFVVFLAQFLSFIPMLNFLGRNSLVVMTLHVPFGFNLYNLLVRGKFHLEIKNQDLLGITVTICTIVILIPVCMIINNYFPFILGRKLNKRAKEKQLSY